MEKKDIKIFLISGKARHGKGTVGSYIKEYYTKQGLKVAFSQISAYIKYYANKYFDWDGKEETKPRTLLQQLGTEVIRHNISDTFFINRTIEDINILAYFFDIIIIDDIRFENEITLIVKEFPFVKSINVKRINYETVLSSSEQQHSTEKGLDNYQDYDYQLVNNTLKELKQDVFKILEEIDGEKY